uniref:Uncharacterized protein n=1 Tax=Vespula pensylvanica TaxID=30213 RepID=A0A834U9H1_VESPE|nr:hypothetical protein H0235_009040 [Vespula pensylvanica]
MKGLKVILTLIVFTVVFRGFQPSVFLEITFTSSEVYEPSVSERRFAFEQTPTNEHSLAYRIARTPVRVRDTESEELGVAANLKGLPYPSPLWKERLKPQYNTTGFVEKGDPS